MIWHRDCRAYSRIGARNDFPVHEKRGSASYQEEDGWVLGTGMPILKDDGREYAMWLLDPQD